MRLIVASCGASGINYVSLLIKELKKRKVEMHLIFSEWAKKVANFEEQQLTYKGIKIYNNDELDASISSTSFPVDAMVILPASIKTASDIANAHTDNLIARCADNMLRQRKKLILCIRETPLSTPALKNLYKISLYGGIVFPLSPAFYSKPKSISDIEAFIVGKILDLLSIENELYKRWNYGL
ncbi:MAG: UbiX family flavin prenyltransferase [Candidatus Diapherotrites archaeon]|nr:UbiX family flavin prenyltransferase [Candidatus Diapherotrites archaeon]